MTGSMAESQQMEVSTRHLLSLLDLCPWKQESHVVPWMSVQRQNNQTSWVI